MTHTKLSATSQVALKQVIEFVLDNLEPDEYSPIEGDMVLDFMENKSFILALSKDEVDELKSIMDADILDVELSNY